MDSILYVRLSIIYRDYNLYIYIYIHVIFFFQKNLQGLQPLVPCVRRWLYVQIDYIICGIDIETRNINVKCWMVYGYSCKCITLEQMPQKSLCFNIVQMLYIQFFQNDCLHFCYQNKMQKYYWKIKPNGILLMLLYQKYCTSE